MKNVAFGSKRPRKPFYTLIIEREPNMFKMLRHDLPVLLPGIKFEFVKKLTEIAADLALAEPANGDLIPKVIVYGPSGKESADYIDACCGLIRGVCPKTKRLAPKIILFAACPVPQLTLTNVTIVMKPNVNALCEAIKGFMPQRVRTASP
jgi:hypothetical protein